jgi:predicted dehydrogenase
MGTRLRIGVVGVGFGATVQIPGFLSEDVEVVAVAARRPERARQAAERFGIPRVTTELEELLAMPDIEAVSVVTPHSLHCKMACAVLNAGKHILCEKPFALDAVEAAEMVDASRHHPELTAMVGHEFRWAPQRAFVKHLLDRGYVGRLHHVVASLQIGGPSRTGGLIRAPSPDLGWRGGLLWALGSHYLDAFRHWFGDITAVSAYMTTEIPARIGPSGETVHTRADDSFAITVEFLGGGWGTLLVSSAATYGSGTTIDIYGSTGRLSAPQPLPLAFNPPPDGRVYGANAETPELTELPIPTVFRPFEDERDHRLMAFRLMVREFLHGIEQHYSPAPNFEDGYRLQLVLDAAVESAATGQRVTITPTY